ncbi:MAG: cytidylyltransferase domain-containing protein [Solirubrobacterales bacterium]
MSKNVVAIIQTRMGSTRLPGKVLLDLCGRPVIYHVIDRVLQSRHINRIVIATTVEPGDDVIVKTIDGYHPNVSVFRGSQDDVLDRYYQAASQSNADLVVRITSDCPLIDPVITDSVIDAYSRGAYSYVSNIGERSFPRGLDTEVFSFAALETAWRDARLPDEREHVTPFIRNHPERFPAFNLASPIDCSRYRWTLDTSDDWAFIKAIYQRLYQGNSYFEYEAVLRLLEQHPELAGLNAHVQQKA